MLQHSVGFAVLVSVCYCGCPRARSAQSTCLPQSGWGGTWQNSLTSQQTGRKVKQLRGLKLSTRHKQQTRSLSKSHLQYFFLLKEPTTGFAVTKSPYLTMEDVFWRRLLVLDVPDQRHTVWIMRRLLVITV